MESTGWRMPTFATFMVTAPETACGTLLLVGLLTPCAACAVIAAMIDAGAVATTALLFTGAGTFTLDAKMFGRAAGRESPPSDGSRVLLNGSNPIHVGNPAAQNLPTGRNCHQTPNRDSKSS